MNTTAHSSAAEEPAASELWRIALARSFGELRAERLSTSHGPVEEPRGDMRSVSLGRTHAFCVAGTPQIVRKTPTSVSQAGDDPLKICIQQRGTAVVHQGPGEIALEPGQMAIYDTGRPYDLRLDGNWACAVLTIPREALAVTERAMQDAFLHPWDMTSGPGSVLTHLLMTSTSDPSPAHAAEHLGEATLLLIAGLLGGAMPDLDDRDGEALRARVTLYVRTHLRDERLAHRSVATALALSQRTLTRLFEGEEETVSAMIRRLRLEAIRTDLLDPAQERRTTMAIASTWGYRDPAHFTRSFRSHFGVTPGALRRAGAASRFEPTPGGRPSVSSTRIEA